jgi:hypothetical protein
VIVLDTRAADVVQIGPVSVRVTLYSMRNLSIGPGRKEVAPDHQKPSLVDHTGGVFRSNVRLSTMLCEGGMLCVEN